MTKRNKNFIELLWCMFCFICTKVHAVTAKVLGYVVGVLKKLVVKLNIRARLSLLSLFPAALFIMSSLWLMSSMWQAAEWEKPVLDFFAKSGTMENFSLIKSALFWVGIAYAVAALAAWLRNKVVASLFKIIAAAGAVIWFWLCFFIVNTANLLLANVEEFDKYTRNDFYMHWSLLLVPGVIIVGFYILSVCLKSVSDYYKSTVSNTFKTDRIFEDVTTMGKDPKYRSSWLWSFTMHASILIVPLLFRGCMLEGYRLPKGDGAQPQVVKIKKIKKKKVEQLVFNPNSAISYYVPEINKKVLEELEEQTENQYKSQSLVGKNNNKSGKPGWPSGMENAKIRFIRLKYKGGDWDQNMGHGADYNFLLEFKKMTGFKIASDTEAIEIMDIKRFPKKQKPPFLYITGKGGISLSSSEIKQLKTYLTDEGGMLFADNGGGRFNQSLRSLMKRVFPENNWIDIANDDYIYQQPFLFPSGAPPLWHHSGNRALGIKHNGRWVVFYHQGDINDAWQTGASGVSQATRTQAFKMGINVVNYAFNQYMSIHYD